MQTKKVLKETLKHATEAAKDGKNIANGMGDSFQNVVLAYKDSSAYEPLPFDFKSDEEKQFKIFVLKKMFEDINPDMVVLVMDAWWSMLDKDEEIVRPSKDLERRQEALIINYEAKVRGGIKDGCIVIPYKYNSDGLIEYEKAKTFGDGDDSTMGHNKFGNLLGSC